MSSPVRGSDEFGADAVRHQLQRILASGTFANAPSLSQFLRYVVEHSVGGVETPIKEYTIGVDVFRRGSDFDPHVDTIVRVQARRLRKYLAKYYEGEGRDDPLWITMPKGHYRAELVARGASVGAAAQGQLDQDATESVEQGLRFRSDWLPAPRTPLVGRGREMGELDALLAGDGPRLITLTGPAGSGKTRLAVEVARRAQEARFDDVILIALASVTDASTLQVALLRALNLGSAENTPPTEIVCRYLQQRDRTLLLVLDSFERLAAAASLIGSMLDACASLKVLVTSRVVLHIYGEHEYPLMPLTLPKRDSLPPEELAANPAVALFVQRAVAVNPQFRLTDANAEAVIRICRHLDGLPLGIELAAAQCLVLAPAQLLQHFPGPLDLPGERIEDVPHRQRNLRGAIEWSHDLLTVEERRLYRRLAVFSGGLTLGAAEAVANVRGDLGISVVEGVAKLLDDSLLDLISDPTERRYIMLETIRAYGMERLNASGECNDIRRAHAAYFLVLAEEGSGQSAKEQRSEWLARCDLEQDNFRAALACLIEQGDGPRTLRLTRALFFYWWRRGHFAEARQIHRAVLERFGADADLEAWGQVSFHASTLDDHIGAHDVARARFPQIIEVARRKGNRKIEIMAVAALGASWEMERHYREARECFERSLELCQAMGEPREIAAAQSSLANVLLALGEHVQAQGLLERALANFRQLREWVSAAWCVNSLGAVAVASACYDEAQDLYQQGAERFLQSNEYLAVAKSWVDLAYLALQQGQPDKAAALFTDALWMTRRPGCESGVANVIEGCAVLAVATKRFSQALVLAEATQTVRSSMQMEAYAEPRVKLATALQPARDALDAAQAAACRLRGAAMNLEQAIDYAMQSLADEPDSAVDI